MEDEEDIEEQPEISHPKTDHLKPWQFKKGQSGNPGGRPLGSVSLKEWAKRMMMSMTDEERLDFMEGIDKKTIWEMSEGKPESTTDITSGGKPLVINTILYGSDDTPPVQT